MIIRQTALMLLAGTLAVSIAADAAEAKSKRKRMAKPVAAQPWSGHQQAARMIEVRPGYWVSSYGCVTDEGYGRLAPCDLTDSSR